MHPPHRGGSAVVFAEDCELVNSVFRSFEPNMREPHLTIAEFSRMCLLTLCTLDLGLPMDDDLVMVGPFEEPDEHFPRRQREAFGRETEAIA